MASVYLLRIAPNEVEKIDVALRRNRIYIGWRTPGLLASGLTKEDFRRAFRESFPGKSSGHCRSAIGNLRRFIVEMKPGDLVIVPPNKPRPFFLARIIGLAREYRGKDPDIAFERPVEWLNGKQPFMRAEVSAQLNEFLNSRGTSRLLQDEQLLREVESLIGGNKWLYPDELDESARYWEGTQRQVIVNAYERDPKARTACIKHYGAVCVVCGFDFEAQYGEYGAGLIHVHHVLPLS